MDHNPRKGSDPGSEQDQVINGSDDQNESTDY